MSHTGIFKILDLTYQESPEGQLARALNIKATCTSCGSFSVWHEDQMEHVPGGTVLSCPACGVRQAISNARLCGYQAGMRRGAVS